MNVRWLHTETLRDNSLDDVCKVLAVLSPHHDGRTFRVLTQIQSPDRPFAVSGLNSNKQQLFAQPKPCSILNHTKEWNLIARLMAATPA